MPLAIIASPQILLPSERVEVVARIKSFSEASPLFTQHGFNILGAYARVSTSRSRARVDVHVMMDMSPRAAHDLRGAYPMPNPRELPGTRITLHYENTATAIYLNRFTGGQGVFSEPLIVDPHLEAAFGVLAWKQDLSVAALAYAFDCAHLLHALTDEPRNYAQLGKNASIVLEEGLLMASTLPAAAAGSTPLGRDLCAEDLRAGALEVLQSQPSFPSHEETLRWVTQRLASADLPVVKPASSPEFRKARLDALEVPRRPFLIDPEAARKAVLLTDGSLRPLVPTLRSTILSAHQATYGAAPESRPEAEVDEFLL